MKQTYTIAALVLLLAHAATVQGNNTGEGSCVTLTNNAPNSIRVVDTKGEKSVWPRVDLQPGASYTTCGAASGYWEQDVVLAITVLDWTSPFLKTKSIFNDGYITVGYMRFDNPDQRSTCDSAFFETGIDCQGDVWGNCVADSNRITHCNANQNVGLSAESGKYTTSMHVQAVDPAPTNPNYYNWNVQLFSVASTK